LALQQDSEELEKFLADPFWAFRKKKLSSDILLNAVVFISKAKGEQRYDRAEKYARVLGRYAAKHLPAEDVCEQLNRDGGIEKALKMARIEQPRRKAKAQTQRELHRRKLIDTTGAGEQGTKFVVRRPLGGKKRSSVVAVDYAILDINLDPVGSG
jgi:hypothetical protein